eukprot:gene22771-34895_t
MSSYPPVKKPTQDATATSHKIRIVLSSRKVPALERACTDLVKRAKDEQLR